MSCSQCVGIEQEFDAKRAQRELKRYRRKGMRKTTRWLVDALRNEDIGGMTLLDIGGGVGAIPLELFKSGLKSATGVDASTAYLQTAREEAERQGVDERVTYVKGDFVEAADEIAPADIATLDRVVCCYDDMPALIGASAARARHLYALVYPRDTWWTRLLADAANAWLRLRRSEMRTFVHPANEVDALVRQRGFHLQSHQMTHFWRVDVYRR